MMPLRSVMLVLLLAMHARGQALVSGERLRVSGDDGVGVLASPDAYKGYPLGYATLTGGARPDLFFNAPNGVTRALYLFRYHSDDAEGTPIFASPVQLTHPWGDKNAPAGAVVQDASGAVHGYFYVKGKLVHTTLDPATRAFREGGSVEVKLPTTPQSIGAQLRGDRVLIVATCSNGAIYRPEGDQASNDYVLYDGTGRFRGELTYSGVYGFTLDVDATRVLTPPALLSRSRSEMLGGSHGVDPVRYASEGVSGFVAGSRLGNLTFFPAEPGASQFGESKLLAGPDGITLRHPTSDAAVRGYPNASGEVTDLVVGGEGACWYYRFTGAFDQTGRPIYEKPVETLLADAQLYTGSLPVPSAADFTGDGAQDLLVGNSAGLVLLFVNRGTNAQPRFDRGEPVEAGGEPIWIQPGYHGIQGPFEARWGYTCPTAADWNGDGLTDILLSDATATHKVYLNVGTASEPRFAPPSPLYLDGMPLHGTWRVRPGVAEMDGRMAYIILDTDNALHLYWRLDDHNVTDGGKLTLEDGSFMTAHPGGADARPGNSGRSKIEAVDWDGDGKVDLLVGGAKRNSIPDPQRGLPWTRYQKTPGMQTIFLRNVGTNAKPVYAFPKQMQFRGKDLVLGAHAQSPAACLLGDTSDGRPNLIYGMESGRLYFFDHHDVTFLDSPQ